MCELKAEAHRVQTVQRRVAKVLKTPEPEGAGLG